MVSIFPLPTSPEPIAPLAWDFSPCRWRVVGAQAAGTSHLKQNLPCQDAQAYRLLALGQGEVLAAALADGAGSAEHSDQGSACAVEAALLAVESELAGSDPLQIDPAGLLRLAFETARLALEELAARQEISLRSLATTLTVVLAHGGGLAAGQLGDGAVVVKTSGQELITLTQPQRGEYANETYFLSQENAMDRLQISHLAEPVEALAVLSDGLMRLALKMPGGEPHPPFFAPLFGFAASASGPDAQSQLEDFLNSERVCARTDDDKSLVLAVCSERTGAR
jgi:hypothetical protein